VAFDHEDSLMASRNMVALLLSLCVIAVLAKTPGAMAPRNPVLKTTESKPTPTPSSLARESRKAAGPLPNESAILAAVIDDHVKNLEPPFQPGEVVIVSSNSFSPQAEIEDYSYGRQNLMKTCEEIGVDPAVLDVLAHNSQPGQWDLDSWPTSVKLRNTEEFYRHFSGIETFNDALEKGGPGRQVFSFCRPVLDESTGDIVVYAREWTATQYGVLYRLRPGRGDGHLQVIFKSREIGIY